MTFAEECDADMLDMLEEFGVPITFDGKSAKCVTSQLTASNDIQPSGYQAMFSEEARMRLEDFERLGIKFQSEVDIDGTAVRVTQIITQAFLAILEIKATR